MGTDDYKDLEEATPSTMASRLKSLRKRDFVYFLPILLCAYSILKEIKVGEPFMYKYQTEYLNLTADQLTSEIYPYFPYAYLFSLIPIFLLTDLFLYKPTMLTEVLGQIGFRASLVFTNDITSQQAGQIAY
uniref:Uncharacterized protein n=1 Tax=Panagrolaimus sp. JU765 TaxID=591449 RepID=A0AC34PYB3_9BILA